jgi:predicted DCC family thiol-disulfide oxidoreductase YuxK
MNFSPATFRTLGFVRVVVFSLWLGIVATDPFYELAALPPEIFDAYGLMQLIPEAVQGWILTPAFLHAFKWVLSLGLVFCVLSGRPYLVVAVATVLMLTFHQGLVRGFGFINHKELGLLYVAYVLALFPAHQGFTWLKTDRALEARPAPVAALALQSMTVVLLLLYTFIAVYRIAQGSPAIFLNGTMTFHLAEAALRTGDYGMEFAQSVLHQPLLLQLANAGYAISTWMEVLALLCLVSRKFRIAWIAFMVVFHVSTLVFMNIWFWQNVLLIGLLLTDVSRLVSPPLPTARTRPVVFYDATCGLCGRFIRFLKKRDIFGVLTFEPLDGEQAQAMGILREAAPHAQSMAYADEKGVWRKSNAALRALARLGGFLGFALLLTTIPHSIRDAIYTVIARNRYRLFGPTSCSLPNPARRRTVS